VKGLKEDKERLDIEERERKIDRRESPECCSGQVQEG